MSATALFVNALRVCLGLDPLPVSGATNAQRARRGLKLSGNRNARRDARGRFA